MDMQCNGWPCQDDLVCSAFFVRSFDFSCAVTGRKKVVHITVLLPHFSTKRAKVLSEGNLEIRNSKSSIFLAILRLEHDFVR